MHAQLRSVQLYIDQLRSAAPCGAVPGRALPCAAVLCRAALCFLSNIEQYQVYYVLFFIFLNLISLGPQVFPRTQVTPILPIRTWHRQQAQDNTGQFALHKQLLAISNHCSPQIMGLFFLPPLHVLVAFVVARA